MRRPGCDGALQGKPGFAENNGASFWCDKKDEGGKKGEGVNVREGLASMSKYYL